MTRFQMKTHVRFKLRSWGATKGGLVNRKANKFVRLAQCVLAALVAFGSASGQPAVSSATADELGYFRFLFMNVASFDNASDTLKTPEHTKSFEQHLTIALGINAQESAVIHAAAAAYGATLQRTAAVRNRITDGKTYLSPSDNAAIASLNAQVESELASQANWLLSSVRPETATRLRVPGHIVAAAQAKGVQK
jgi:hypothetical protein